MMHGGGNSDPLVAVKPTNQAERSAAESGAKGGDQGECGSKARPGLRAGQARHRRRNAYGGSRKSVSPLHTRGGSRMRESCMYGSVRGCTAMPALIFCS
jgi:hypothetical protein